MKATIERATLLRCLSHVQSVVERRNTIPILSNVLIEAEGNRIRHLANGQIKSDAKEPLPARLSHLASQLDAILADNAPDAAAAEEIFVNKNAQSTLKLAQARGALLLSIARTGIAVGEYAPRLVKKAVVGTGGADKSQVQAMLKVLLPGAQVAGADAADALAVAIADAHLAG